MLQVMSANSSQTDIYAMVDKKKKTSAPSFPAPSTRPVRRHDYEEMDSEDFPPKPPLPHQHSDAKPNSSVPSKTNGNVPPKIPAPYHSSSSTEFNSPKKFSEFHSNSADMLPTSASNTRCGGL